MLVTNLPGRNQTLRMRLWRGLRTAGAGMLRDGVYVLPHSDVALRAFEEYAREVVAGGGSAQLVAFDSESDTQRATLTTLFDRTAEYTSLMDRIGRYRRAAVKLDVADVRRELGVLKREAAGLRAMDFFPTKVSEHLEQALGDAELQLTMRTSPDEPHAIHRAIPKRAAAEYQQRVWATRKHLWIDRVCSAWLIKRFVDPKARFRWLDDVKQCPTRAIGFDFDEAEFTHVDGKVTFEVLAVSFALDHDIALSRIGHVVHYLDVGGVPVPEAAGLAAIVTGARARAANDDELIDSVFPVLDLLYSAFADKTGDEDGPPKTSDSAPLARQSTRKRQRRTGSNASRKDGRRTRVGRTRR